MFTQKFLKIGTPIVLILFAILALVQAPFISPFVLGGVILQGILGGFSGKVGPVVGGKWKDVDYMRSYVIPANPNTVGQQAVRSKFSALVAAARKILSDILQPYWDPFVTSMSGFNRWISLNYSLTDSAGVIDSDVIMSRGSLETLGVNASTYTAVTGEVIANFDNTPSGNGLITDSVGLIVYVQSTKTFYTLLTGVVRDDESISISIPSSLTATDVITWIFAFRGTGSDLEVSDSIGDVCSAG
jgi:hypothetical protein